jgi:signal transduction histidine kinase
LTPPTFRIVVDLHDGRWLTIEPSDAAHGRLIQSLAFIFAGTLIVAAIAVLTARSLIAPLYAPATAADTLGRSREITETRRPSIPQLAAIHDAFVIMQRRLKRFVSERTLMLAAISHDLRTPLARLGLQAEFISDGDLRKGMLANIDAMRDMLAGTLSFAEGDAASELPASIDLASMLISLCDETSDAGAKVEYEGPNHATLCGRRTAIRRMFANLIDNAVRYSGAARVSLDKRLNDWIVTVADDGPGIPPELFEKAFEPFQRLESSRNRDTGGTGLGLSIARDIALAHGGRITLANAPAGSSGLIVTVLLPRRWQGRRGLLTARRGGSRRRPGYCCMGPTAGHSRSAPSLPDQVPNEHAENTGAPKAPTPGRASRP